MYRNFKIMYLVALIFLLLAVFLANTAYADTTEYTIEFKEYTPDNVGDLTYIKWENNVVVGGQNCPLNDQITALNLNSEIIVTGKNNADNLIYEGKYEGVLLTGLNEIEIEVLKVNTNPDVWSPGDDSYTWNIKIFVTAVTVTSPTPSNTTTISPTSSQTPNPSNSVIPSPSNTNPVNTDLATPTPTASIVNHTLANNKELPETRR